MFPENKKQNIAPYNGAIILFNAHTGIPEVILNDKGVKTYNIGFNPFNAHVNKNTKVSVKSVLNGFPTFNEYENITAKCP